MRHGSFLGFSHVIKYSGGLVHSCRRSARCEALHAARSLDGLVASCWHGACRFATAPTVFPCPTACIQVLPRALRHMLAKSDDKTKAAVNKVIRVWDERKVGQMDGLSPLTQFCQESKPAQLPARAALGGLTVVGGLQ